MFEKNGYTITSLPFSCKVWNNGDSRMEWNEKQQRIMASPYSKGFCGEGNVRIVENLEELQETDCEDAILFLTEELAEKLYRYMQMYGRINPELLKRKKKEK